MGGGNSFFENFGGINEKYFQKYLVVKIYSTTFAPLNERRPLSFSAKTLGKVAEWSIAPVLKTDVLRGTGGSNPSLSAKERENIQIYLSIFSLFFVAILPLAGEDGRCCICKFCG